MRQLPQSKRIKGDRLEARVSSEIKALFQEAAAIQGRSVTDFVVASAVEAAARTVRDRDLLNLSKRDRTAFVEALLNPPAPNERLRRAAERYQQMFGSEGT
jgi:uncharacterized protein (DUF1778 family)